MKKKFYILLVILSFLVNGTAIAATSQKEVKPMKKIVQTAGKDQLGSFAPEFAHFNDDVLFG